MPAGHGFFFIDLHADEKRGFTGLEETSRAGGLALPFAGEASADLLGQCLCIRSASQQATGAALWIRREQHAGIVAQDFDDVFRVAAVLLVVIKKVTRVDGGKKAAGFPGRAVNVAQDGDQKLAVGRCRLLRRGLPALVEVAPLPGEGSAQEMTGKFVVRQEGLQVDPGADVGRVGTGHDHPLGIQA